MADQADRAIAEFELRTSSDWQSHAELTAILAAICFRDREFKRGIEIVRRAQESGDVQAIALNVLLNLGKANVNTAPAGIELPSHDLADGTANCLFLWTALKLHGDTDGAEQIGELFYASAKQRSLFDEEIACADYLRGEQTDPAKLLSRCLESQSFTSVAHFAIAVDALSRADRDKAKMHFLSSESSADYRSSLFWWGRAFLARVDDPVWLNSINPAIESATPNAG